MIGVQLAQRLKEAGLVWKPALGDRFAIPDRDLDDEVFVLSNMTIEVHTLPEGRVIGFNGTTEWALDDVEIDEAIWLPREDQLRELLGGTFRQLASRRGRIRGGDRPAGRGASFHGRKCRCHVRGGAVAPARGVGRRRRLSQPAGTAATRAASASASSRSAGRTVTCSRT